MDRASRIINRAAASTISRRRFLASAVGVPLLLGLTRKSFGIIGVLGGSAAPNLIYDYYISTTGNDSSSGSLTSPWAITSLQTTSGNWSKLAGSSIGLLPGIYNVGSMMIDDPISGALQIPGGSSLAWTYLGSSASNGIYSRGAATITAYYNSLYGGHTSSGAGQWDGPMLSHSGEYPTTYPVGYLTIDGIVFTGFNYKGVRIGGYSSGDGPIVTGPVTIQNCEFTGGGFNSGDFEDNLTALWIDTFQPSGSQGCLVTNNWMHDIVGFSADDGDHLSPLFVFAANSAQTPGYGYEFSYNTVYNAGGGPYGKEGGIEGSNVHHNYVDVSMFTSFSTGYLDWASGSSDEETGLTKTTSFNHNILIIRGNTAGSNNGFGFPTLGQNSNGSAYGWQTPVECYNNTIISASGSAGPLALYLATCSNGVGQGQVQAYNNIYVNNGSSGSWNGFGNFMTTAKSPAVWDYNLYPSSGMQWALQASSGSPVEAANGSMFASTSLIYTSASSFAAAVAAAGGISGIEAHGVAGTPTFTGTGILAAQYQLASGSAGKNAGSDGTDMGAWGAGATQIGCSFATAT